MHETMRDRINAALKDAQRTADKRRCATLRLIQAAVTHRETTVRETGKDSLGDLEVIEILQKMVSQRNISAEEFESSGKLELSEQERIERDIIREFLPEQFGDEKMREACETTVRDIEAHGLRDIGRCMSELKARYPGQMDFVQASGVMKDLLRNNGSAARAEEGGQPG